MSIPATDLVVPVEFEDDEDTEIIDEAPDASHYRIVITGKRLDGRTETEFVGLMAYDNDNACRYENGSEPVMWQGISCLSLLCLAGLRVFFDVARKLTFVEPPSTWAELAFERLPAVASNNGYHDLIWGTFSGVEVILWDQWEGKVLKRLRLNPPRAHNAPLTLAEELDRKLSLIAIKDDEASVEPVRSDGYDLILSIKVASGFTEHPQLDIGFLGEYSDEIRYMGMEGENETYWLPIANIFSLAGAGVFFDHPTGFLMLDPRGDLIQLAFEKVPHASAKLQYAPFLWRRFTSITLSLKAHPSGTVLQEIRLTPPESKEWKG